MKLLPQFLIVEQILINAWHLNRKSHFDYSEWDFLLFVNALIFFKIIVLKIALFLIESLSYDKDR